MPSMVENSYGDTLWWETLRVLQNKKNLEQKRLLNFAAPFPPVSSNRPIIVTPYQAKLEKKQSASNLSIIKWPSIDGHCTIKPN